MTEFLLLNILFSMFWINTAVPLIHQALKNDSPMFGCFSRRQILASRSSFWWSEDRKERENSQDTISVSGRYFVFVQRVSYSDQNTREKHFLETHWDSGHDEHKAQQQELHNIH